MEHSDQTGNTYPRPRSHRIVHQFKKIRSVAPMLLLGMAALFWAGNFIAGEAVHQTINPLDLAFGRWAVAGAAITIIGFPKLRRQGLLLLENWRRLLLLGATGTAGYSVVSYRALQETTAINASIFLSLIPLVILLLSWIFLREKIRPFQVGGIFISLAGVATVVIRGDLHQLVHFQFNHGDLWMLVSLPIWAVYTIQLKRMPRTLDTICILAGSIYTGLLILLPFQLYERALGHHLIWTGENILAILYVGLFTSLGAFLAWNKGVLRLGPNRAAVFLHLIPVFAAVLSFFLLGEAFQVFHAIGITLVLSGVYIASRNTILNNYHQN